MPAYTDEQLDAGADALRQYEQGGKRRRLWALLPNSSKKKWRLKADVVLEATAKARHDVG